MLFMQEKKLKQMINSSINNFDDLKKEQQRLQSLIGAKEVDLEYKLTNAVSARTVKNEVFKSVRNSKPMLGDLLKATISTKVLNAVGRIVLKRAQKMFR